MMRALPYRSGFTLQSFFAHFGTSTRSASSVESSSVTEVSVQKRISVTIPNAKFDLKNKFNHFKEETIR